jgi:sodium-dependent dicarboxylate transporter 2/3/5
VALFALAATLWLSEAISLTYTALLIPVIGVALGIADVRTAMSGFAHPVIGLFLGGFALAAALSAHGIDRWLASRLMSLARGKALNAAVLLALATSLLSMWISNTAAAAMMLPVALGLAVPLAGKYPRYQLFVLLGLAWGANIGGIATLVGSPPNAITAAELGWGFDDWLKIGIPSYTLLMPLALLVLYLTLKPEKDLPNVRTVEALAFPRHRAAIVTVAIFLITVTLWVLSNPIAELLGIGKDFDTWVALLAIALLGISGTLEWQQIEKQSNWGVLLLFGGGITLSTLMQSSGASEWLASGISQMLPAGQPWLLYLLVAVFVIYLTELVSNTASAALLVPLFMPVASVVGADPITTAAIIGVAASCAFMLPVATPPNALVFGTGHVPQQQMIHAGMRINLLAAVLIPTLLMVLVH